MEHAIVNSYSSHDDLSTVTPSFGNYFLALLLWFIRSFSAPAFTLTSDLGLGIAPLRMQQEVRTMETRT